MKEKIELMLDYLTKLTQDEADLIEVVIKEWDDEMKAAFMFAKKIFEEQINNDSLD